MPDGIFAPEATLPMVQQQMDRDALLAQMQGGEEREAGPPPDPARLARWLALIGSGVFDAVSTRAALGGNPDAREANPVARPFAGNLPALLGLSVGGNVLAGLLADKLAKRGKTKAANGVGFGVAGAKTAIGASNLAKRK